MAVDVLSSRIAEDQATYTPTARFVDINEIELGERHRIAVATLEGDVSPVRIISGLIELVKSKPNLTPLLLLGPATPLGFETFAPLKVGWVTFLTEEFRHQSSGLEIKVLSPENILEVNLFIERFSKESDRKTVLLGDFLDNLLLAFPAHESFHKFYSQFCARVVATDRAAIFVVKKELHDPRRVAIVERFADLVIRYSAIHNRGRVETAFRILDLS